MSDARPIMILSASAGAGHGVAAQAVAQALQRQAPDAQIEVLDVLQVCNAFFRKLYGNGYLGIVNHAPTFMGWLYEAMDRPNPYFRDAFRIGFQNLNARRIVAYIKSRSPRLIVNTHFLPAELVAQMIRCGQLDCQQVTITTDFETHRLWVQPPTARYYTATEEGKAYLTTWDVRPESIAVTGIPVREPFEQPVDKAAVCAQHGLTPDTPIVLLLCGGFGVGPTERLLRELIAMPAVAQIVVVAGRNEPLRMRLGALAERAARRVHVLGLTDRMHEWMRIADLVVTKPGGLTAAESLVCGLPMVVVNPIPGQEARNSDYLLENGAAIKVNNLRILGPRVSSLLSDAARLAALRRAAQALGRPGAAIRIAADALALLPARANLTNPTVA